MSQSTCLPVFQIFTKFRGMIPPKSQRSGECEKGYEGVQCSSCIEGYNTFGSFKCVECAQDPELALLGIIIFALIMMGLMIK
jgi:hypothetical protein